MRVLIVDDEAPARARLKDCWRTARAKCAGSDRRGRAARGASTCSRTKHTDVVLLDIRMPEMDGIGSRSIAELPDPPAIVFTTAYDAYAIHASKCTRSITAEADTRGAAQDASVGAGNSQPQRRGAA